MTVESHRSFRLSRRPDAVLSSGSTSFYKRWFPAIWLGLPAVALLGQLFRIARVGHVTPKDLGLLGVCILFLAVGIPIFRRLAFCLVDEVVDEGDFLLVRSERHQERVPLGSIAGRISGLSSASEGLSRIFAGGLSQGITSLGASVSALVNPFTLAVGGIAAFGAAASATVVVRKDAAAPGEPLVFRFAGCARFVMRCQSRYGPVIDASVSQGQ